jgi:hypothetical protein
MPGQFEMGRSVPSLERRRRLTIDISRPRPIWGSPQHPGK